VRRRLVTGGLALLAAAMVVLAIRSWTTDESDRARASVERFAAAVEARDYATICDRLLAADLKDALRAVDLPCDQALRTGLGRVRGPRLTVENVVVVDDRARAAVRTDAVGQPPSADVLSLVRQSGDWRISALNQSASAATATAPTPPPQTVVTTGAPAPGGLVPRPSGLPDDARIQDRAGVGKTPAEKRRDARLRALQRRALRLQGDRGE
jgi:hypothetical protein